MSNMYIHILQTIVLQELLLLSFIIIMLVIDVSFI